MTSMLRVCALLAAVLTWSGLASAADPAHPAGGTQPGVSPIRPVASFQEIMLALVNPSATDLWNAVSTQSTAEGVIEHKPTTDEQWLELRHQALILIESGNLLLLKNRPIVTRGAKIKDQDLPGILGPAEIRRRMDADPARLARLLHALQGSAEQALAAIDKKDADALTDAGGEIDEACEACHKTYWYPDALAPQARK